MARLFLGLDPTEPLGADDVHLPLIEIVPLSVDWNKIPPMESFDYCLITSRQTVRFVPQIIGCQVVAVGAGTAKSLGQPCLIPKEATQEGMITLLKELGVGDGTRILYPRSALARPLLAETIEEMGAKLWAPPVYTARARSGTTLPALESFEEIVFTSPSVVNSFFDLSPKGWNCEQFSCIGPVTKKCLQSALSQRVITGHLGVKEG